MGGGLYFLVEIELKMVKMLAFTNLKQDNHKNINQVSITLNCGMVRNRIQGISGDVGIDCTYPINPFLGQLTALKGLSCISPQRGKSADPDL